MKKQFTSITQPAGKFYISKMLASELIPISQSEVRTPYNSTGIQRLLSQKRVYEIAEFCENKSAMFPTPIIISAKSNVVSFLDKDKKPLLDNYTNLEEGFLSIDVEKIKSEKIFFSIVDGQHRLAGIEKYFERCSGNKREDFELSVLFVFDTENYEDAKIFSAINRHQKPVSKSLVYDLYGLSDDITVEKFAHEIVDRINSDSNSLMKDRVKMLGYKTDSEIVSQATLVEQIMPLVSKNIQEDNKLLIDGYSPASDEKLILREYLINYQIEELSDLLIKFLNSWITVLKDRNLYQKVLQKTVGFMLAFEVFKDLYNYLGNSRFVRYDETELSNVLIKRFLFDNLIVDDIASSKAGVRKAFEKLIEKGHSFTLDESNEYRRVVTLNKDNDMSVDKIIYKVPAGKYKVTTDYEKVVAVGVVKDTLNNIGGSYPDEFIYVGEMYNLTGKPENYNENLAKGEVIIEVSEDESISVPEDHTLFLEKQ